MGGSLSAVRKALPRTRTHHLVADQWERANLDRSEVLIALVPCRGGTSQTEYVGTPGGEVEVDQIWMAARCQQNIRWFDVTVDQTMFMKEFNAGEQSSRDGDHSLFVGHVCVEQKSGVGRNRRIACACPSLSGLSQHICRLGGWGWFGPHADKRASFKVAAPEKGITITCQGPVCRAESIGMRCECVNCASVSASPLSV